MKRETCNVTDNGLSYLPSAIEPIISTIRVTERNTAIRNVTEGNSAIKKHLRCSIFQQIDWMQSWFPEHMKHCQVQIIT